MRPLLLSLSHLDFPRNNLPSPSSTSLSPWCPRDWRRRSPEFGPQGELPSPSLILSLPLPSSSLPCAPPLSPCARRRPPPAPPPPAALARPAPASSAAALAHPLPLPPARWCSPAPALDPCGGARPPLPLPHAAAPAPGPGVVRPPLSPARPRSRRAAPCARPRPPARGVPAPSVTRVASFTPLTHSRVRKPTRAVIISGL
jgi:hypothetical protein